MKLTKDLVAISLLTVIMTVYAFVIVVLIRDVDHIIKEINENQVQTIRFANYMRCLIVPNEARYAELGREAYVKECELLLFK